VPPPEKPPRLFIDRSLGRIAVPRLLRADGWDVITLSEHYGMPIAEQPLPGNAARPRPVTALSPAAGPVSLT
jgi:hypothetical protein